MAFPTEDKIRKWASEAADHYSQEYGSEEAIWEKVGALLNTKVIAEAVARATGFRHNHWGDFETTDDFEKKPLYKAVAKVIPQYLALALDGYEVKLSQREITTIRAAYKRSYLEAVKHAAEVKGIEDAEAKIQAALAEVIGGME